MPAVAEEQVTAFAHCGTPVCPGTDQVQVDAIRRETTWTYIENGGDLPSPERSQVMLVFANEEDQSCPSCGRLRELSAEPRPQYQALSGFDQNYLRQVAEGTMPGFDPSVTNTPADERVAALEAQVAKLAAALESKDEESGSA